jgi:uncharacterized membrane protein YpjA
MLNFKALSFFWSEVFLLNRSFLWMLFVVNLCGTIYGYFWYENQIIYTLDHYPAGLVLFVPDSPTASLFFTIAILYLIVANTYRSSFHRIHRFLLQIIEAFAVVTLFKYGIWAVTMIIAGASLGDPLSWQEWMLVCSHLGMACEGIIFARFFIYRGWAIFLIGIWSLWNDYMDYGIGIFPWLPKVLHPYLQEIAIFTVLLGFISLLLAYGVVSNKRKMF